MLKKKKKKLPTYCKAADYLTFSDGSVTEEECVFSPTCLVWDGMGGVWEG